MIEFLNLPPEIITIICKELDTSSKIKLSKTCRLLNNILTDKSLVSNLDLSEVLDYDYNDLHFIIENGRYENIKILNIDNWYWTPRKELCRILKRLSNLEELFALDTKLQLKDIASLLIKIPKLNVVSFTITSCQMVPSDLKPYENCFKKLNKVFVEFNCSSAQQGHEKIFLRRICGDNYYEIRKPRLTDYDAHVRTSDSFYSYYIKHRNLDNYSEEDILLQFDFEVYTQTVNLFLPNFMYSSIASWYVLTNFILHDLRHNKLNVCDITKLCLYGVDYNFKGIRFGEPFRNIRWLYLNTKQLFDVVEESKHAGTSNSKRPRLALSTSAPNEQEQPIRTLAAACPDLEVLCIATNSEIKNKPTMMWYPNCLKSISMWTKLKRLSLYDVESRDGQFLKELSEHCPDLVHLTLSLCGPQKTPCFFTKVLCESLVKWRKLQYVNILLSEPHFKDLLKILAMCASLKIIMISGSDKFSFRERSDIKEEDLKYLISNLDKLLLIQVVEPIFSISYANKLQTILRKHFANDRPRLSIHIQHNHDEHFFPLILDVLDLRQWSNWTV